MRLRKLTEKSIYDLCGWELFFLEKRAAASAFSQINLTSEQENVSTELREILKISRNRTPSSKHRSRIVNSFTSGSSHNSKVKLVLLQTLLSGLLLKRPGQSRSQALRRSWTLTVRILVRPFSNRHIDQQVNGQY